MSVACRHECGSGEDAHEFVNPANPSESIGRDAIMGPDEPGATIERAHAAQREWARMPGLERSQRLDAFIDTVGARADQLATGGTLEPGKLFRESKGGAPKSCTGGWLSVGKAARMGAMPVASGRAGFSSRNDLVRRFLAESRNGMTHVNHGTVPDNNMPFGEIRNSGVGACSAGPTAMSSHTSERSAHVAW